MSSKNYFKQVANKWDQMRQDFFSEAVREKAFSIANIQSGTLAADIGAGTGFVTEGLLKEGIRVIAIDQSLEMLQELASKFNHHPHIDCRVGESQNLPILDNTTDYVFANMYLHHVENPADAIKEMVRILKPGGKIIITDLDAHDFTFLKEEHQDFWMGFKRDEIKKWFELADLSQIQLHCIGENCCTKSKYSENAQISIFAAFGSKNVPSSYI